MNVKELGVQKKLVLMFVGMQVYPRKVVLKGNAVYTVRGNVSKYTRKNRPENTREDRPENTPTNAPKIVKSVIF